MPRISLMTQFAAQCLAIRQADEDFLLHPQRVMYWPAKRILFAADVHVGKEHVFARHGIGIPTGISESILDTLFALADESGATRLIVLGDFMHNTPAASESWLHRLSKLLDQNPQFTVEVVAGNHDREAGRRVIDKRVIWHRNSLHIGAVALHHEPCTDSHGYVLCGHLHPAWRIGKANSGSISAPVFWFRKHCAVLPAFGEFTGGVIIKPDPDIDKLYMTGPDCVIEVPCDPTTLKRRSGRKKQS